MPADDVVVVGRIGAPYGVQGWVHLHSFTSPPENLLEYRPWLLQAETGQGWQALAHVECRAHNNGFVAALGGIDSREDAAQLAGRLIGVPPRVLPQTTEPGEFYWRDLVGCQVVNVEGESLGQVVDLMETGANDVLVVATPDAQSEHPRERLIPFVDQVVLNVDIQQRRLTVAWDTEW